MSKLKKYKIKFKNVKTARGFQNLDFKDLYGAECSIQKSSYASEDAIWFGCDKAEVDHVTGQLLSPRMHLTREMVSELIPILQYFADTGKVKVVRNYKNKNIGDISYSEKSDQEIESEYYNSLDKCFICQKGFTNNDLVPWGKENKKYCPSCFDKLENKWEQIGWECVIKK